MAKISRLVPVLEGIVNYGNPLQIFLHRLFTRSGEMTIVDRRTGISVRAMRSSYQMFGETWYYRDYDVLGCPVRRDDIVVDIGANQGFFTCYAAQRGARVYAFEPNPKTFEILKKNLVSNGLADQVEAECVAIADFEGEADLLCSSFLGGGGDTINPRHAEAIGPFGQQLGRVPVRVARLSTLIPSDRNIRLLKMDCEGAELQILKDLKNPERFDSIAIEFHADAYPTEALIKTLLDFGTHQVYIWHCFRAIVHAIRTDILLEFARSTK